MQAESIPKQIDSIARRESGQVLATLIEMLGDFGLAEDVLQDALVAALENWPRQGIPPNPGGWLMTTARRKAIDHLRRQRLWGQKQQVLGADLLAGRAEQLADLSDPIPDDRLKLLFTCCHPALNFDARVALTLRTLGSLSTAEIAHIFLTSIPTMAQRLTRAKQKIRDARIPYRVPPLELLPERVPALLAVLYLIFTAGYTAVEGDALMRLDLAAEAIRLMRVLHGFLTREWQEDPEATGLLALMLLQNSRRDARVSEHGELILLEEQDRSLWNHAEIREGIALVARALDHKRAGPYQIQAAIAAVHARAERPEATDWQQIVVLYDILLEMHPSPVIALNRAVAVAMADGPPSGLALLQEESLTSALGHYHLFHAARADLLRRIGRLAEAREAYEEALRHCQNAVERSFLSRRLHELGHITGE